MSPKDISGRSLGSCSSCCCSNWIAAGAQCALDTLRSLPDIGGGSFFSLTYNKGDLHNRKTGGWTQEKRLHPVSGSERWVTLEFRAVLSVKFPS